KARAVLDSLLALAPDDAGVRQDAGRWEALNRAAVCEQLKMEVTLKLDAGDITSAEALLARMEKTGPREPSTLDARKHIAEWKRSAIDAKRGLLASLLTSAPSGDDLLKARAVLDSLLALAPDDAGVRQDAGRWEALNRAAVCEQLKMEVTLKLDGEDRPQGTLHTGCAPQDCCT
ncbi:MAG: hypothetical protein NTY46_16650, partial [Candidatus Sumerlaeota bacterium]|nr:hypothetical protein [Candidatus Sumerlaeota bacterium]